MLLQLLFMEDQKDPNSRKPWYKRAVEAVNLWRPSKRPTPMVADPNRQRLKRCSSLRIASSLTHACLCAPVASYNEVFARGAVPRRSYSYPRSKNPANAGTVGRPRVSMEGRRAIFRGKSLTENLLMRSFVVEEEAMMQLRRRNEMEIVKRRVAARRRKVGPSRLSRMSMAGEEEVDR